MEAVTIFCARSQFVKASLESRELHELAVPGIGITEVLVYAARHYDDRMRKAR